MPKRGWYAAFRLALRQIIMHSDPQEARRYIRQELWARRNG